jgi:glycerophosphoryl diester phosphodiesterase
MFVLNDDLSIYATRGDIVFFTVSAEQNGKTYTFKAGDTLRIKVFGKKNAKNVVLQKDFPITADVTEVEIMLDETDTKFGGVISKPTDYWYEVELNPMSDPQTIIGYDEDGPKIFKLFPEGADVPEIEIAEEDIPFVDSELDLASPRPVENQAVARAIVQLNAGFEKTREDITKKSQQTATETANAKAEIAVERARINNLVSGATAGDEELVDVRVGANGKTYATAGEAVRGQINALTRGRGALATLLPASTDQYPSISTADKTFTIGGDTLIISDRLSMGYVSLLESKGNHTVTWGNEITSSAICFYYDIATDRLVATNYSDRVVDYNYILLATLRVGSGKYAGKAWAVCSCPIYVDGKLSTEVNHVGGFAAVLPPMNDPVTYPKFKTSDNTVVFPEDTLIIDPRLPNNYVSLQTINDNNSVYFGDFTTSAVCVYYGVAEGKLVAKPYSEVVNTFNYLLLCTVRKTASPYETPMAWASCPVWVDNRLSTESVSAETMASPGGITTMNDVAHRGYCTVAPENTLSAYRMAKKQGFTCVEADISFTSDGVAVLLHDDTVDRTSNGTGKIKELTFAEVRALDFGFWKSEKFAGEIIPTFEEFLLLCKRLGLHPYIELKDGSEAQVKALVETVKLCGMKGKVTWISFVVDFLWWVKQVDEKARLGLVVSTVDQNAIDKVRSKMQTEQNETFIDCAVDNATADAVLLCANADIPLEVWTVDDKDKILSLYPYISGVTSNCLVASNVIYEAGIGE